MKNWLINIIPIKRIFGRENTNSAWVRALKKVAGNKKESNFRKVILIYLFTIMLWNPGNGTGLVPGTWQLTVHPQTLTIKGLCRSKHWCWGGGEGGRHHNKTTTTTNTSYLCIVGIYIFWQPCAICFCNSIKMYNCTTYTKNPFRQYC